MKTVVEVKAVLLGKYAVGKTTLATLYATGKLTHYTDSTIGASFCCKHIRLDDSDIKFAIWDTAGTERFNSILPMYMKVASVVLLCFDEPIVSDLAQRISVIRLHTDAPIILIATKIDDGRRYENVESFAKNEGYDFVYTSCFAGIGVTELFDLAARKGLEFAKSKNFQVGGEKLVTLVPEPKIEALPTNKCGC